MTTPSKPALSALLERVKNAKGADREIDADLLMVFGPPDNQALWNWRAMQPRGTKDRALVEVQREYALKRGPRLTASLDASLALCERVLPGWEILITNEGDPADKWVASIGPRDTFQSFEAERPSAPLALLSALLEARLAQHTEEVR